MWSQQVWPSFLYKYQSCGSLITQFSRPRAATILSSFSLVFFLVLVFILVCKMLYFYIHIPEDTTRLRKHEVLCHVKILEFSYMGFNKNNFFKKKQNPKLSFSLSSSPIKPLPVLFTIGSSSPTILSDRRDYHRAA